MAGYLKGASPVPGPTMIMGLDKSCGSLKSGFLCTYTGILSPTWAQASCTSWDLSKDGRQHKEGSAFVNSPYCPEKESLSSFCAERPLPGYT